MGQDGFDLWLALIGVSYMIPVWRWTVGQGRWSFVRKSTGGAALCMTWGT